MNTLLLLAVTLLLIVVIVIEFPYIRDRVYAYNGKINDNPAKKLRYVVLRVRDIRRAHNLPANCFVLDDETGNVYQISSGIKSEDYICNYYEEVHASCTCCGNLLTHAYCNRCGERAHDRIDMSVIENALIEYGYGKCLSNYY